MIEHYYVHPRAELSKEDITAATAIVTSTGPDWQAKTITTGDGAIWLEVRDAAMPYELLRTGPDVWAGSEVAFYVARWSPEKYAAIHPRSFDSIAELDADGEQIRVIFDTVEAAVRAGIAAHEVHVKERDDNLRDFWSLGVRGLPMLWDRKKAVIHWPGREQFGSDERELRPAAARAGLPELGLRRVK